uniref:Uncharacterized protein n=1 Tax=Panagrolaimus sp. PS1159 TaxID=55785 RepID=A0AC35G1H7_9BILA
MSTKYPILESLKVSEDNFHGYTVFLLGIGIVFLFLTLIRFMLGIMTCLNLIFNGSRKKASEKVKDAKKGASSKEGGSKKKKRRSSKTSSKSSKTSKTSTTKSAATKAKKEEKNRGKSTSPKGKPKPTAAATKKEETSKTDSSLAKKGKSWILEKRKSISDTLTSNSSSVKATSVDLLAAPSKPLTASTTTTATKSVTFDNVPEPANNTAYKYASVATTWQSPIAQDTSGKLFKSDDCPTPNPFKDPNSPIATTPPYVLGAPKVKTPKPSGSENSGAASAPTAPALIAAAAPPKPLSHDYPLYAPHEVPVQFCTENVKTAVESSSYSPGGKKNHPLKTPTKKEPSETVVQIPPPLLPAAFPLQTTPVTTSDTQTQFSVQATPLTTSDTQSQFSLQLTPQTTSDTQKSSTSESPAAPKTAEEMKKI